LVRRKGIVVTDVAFAIFLALAIVAVASLLFWAAHLQTNLKNRTTEVQQFRIQLSARSQELGQLQSQLNDRVQYLFVEWRDREIATVREQLSEMIMEQARAAFQQWQAETEADIRADAVQRSKAVVTGQVTEHLTPYLGTFPYNPKDARFLGAPIDLIVFDGMSEGDLRRIIFLEVKTNTATLSTRERRIREAVQAGRVTWQEFRVSGAPVSTNGQRA
jgi:predicted Holliday junction resolvase-like endonuclease